MFNEVIEAFETEALDPETFFAEYGITSVFDEKMVHLDEYRRAAQHAIDDVLSNGLGNKADWEVWTDKVSMLGREKEEELRVAHEVMLAY